MRRARAREGVRIGPFAFLAACGAILGSLGCSGDSAKGTSDTTSSSTTGGGHDGGAGGAGGAKEGVSVQMDFTRPSGFYDSPFPSDDRMNGSAPDVTGFPNTPHSALVDLVLKIAREDVEGFGVSSAIFFQLDGSLGHTKLPDVHSSTDKDAPVFLISVDSASPDYGKRYPVDVAFASDGGPFGTKNLLSLLPQQGVPLREKTRYAAVVTSRLTSENGKPIVPDPSMQSLASGKAPGGLSSDVLGEYKDAIAALEKLGTPSSSLVGLAVFTTAAPTAQMATVREAMLALPAPEPDAPFAPTDTFPTYCVFQTTIKMPVYQNGKPPYMTDAGGGEWTFDKQGKPVLDHWEKSTFVVTVPKQKMPNAGFPIVLFSRTGAGGNRPLVDRGVQATNGGPPITPGSGPAMYFAMAGFAGASVDGPLGGLRNPTGNPGDEDELIFNVSNPRALRDNIRQSAAELMLQAHILADLSFDASSCEGFDAPSGMVKFDGKATALMGHSMGATITPLTMAGEPAFRAIILSGAGGSWIENIVYKQNPIAIAPVAEYLLNIASSGYALNVHDPLLSMFQWVGEPADPPIYAPAIITSPPSGAPRHVLMEQGIVDTYILPSIADATSLSIGLDLGGKELDVDNPKIAQFTPLSDLLDLVGRQKISLPSQLNVHTQGGDATAIVIQHPQDNVEDGHEIVFQTDPPKREYVCFLRSLVATGKPRVPDDNGTVGTCD